MIIRFARRRSSRISEAGFTLVELAIVLGVLGILVAGLFQLTSASNRQVQDQVTAQQLQQYLKVSRAYLVANLDSSGNIGGAFPVVTAINTAYDITTAVQSFRTGALAGSGLATISPQGFTYTVVLRRLANITVGVTNYPMFSVGIFASGAGNFSRVSMGTVASLVGAEGGAVYTAGTGSCGAGPNILTAFGAVCVPAANFAVGAFSPTTERPAALSFISTLELGSSVSQFLSRVDVPGQPQMTTMSANLHIAGTNNLVMDSTGAIQMAGGSISDTAGNLLISDTVAMGTNDIISVRNITATGNVAAPSISALGSMTWTNGVNMVPQTTASGLPGVFINNALTVQSEVRAGSFIYDSDRRLKRDIAPLADPLAKLLTIKGVSYTMAADGKKRVGVIAQDVEAVYPELISENAEGMKGVDYGALVGPLIESIRILDQQNKELRTRVEKLETKQSRSKEIY